jgi:hypothetical protein
MVAQDVGLINFLHWVVHVFVNRIDLGSVVLDGVDSLILRVIRI